jgi:hypothetical protein
MGPAQRNDGIDSKIRLKNAVDAQIRTRSIQERET